MISAARGSSGAAAAGGGSRGGASVREGGSEGEATVGMETGMDLLNGAVEGAEEARRLGEAGADGGLERSDGGGRVGHLRAADRGADEPTDGCGRLPRSCTSVRLRLHGRLLTGFEYRCQGLVGFTLLSSRTLILLRDRSSSTYVAAKLLADLRR